MSLEVHCDSCGHRFEVAKELAGGFANCPRCGKAASVGGLRDPLWRLWQAGILAALLLASWVAMETAGPLAAATVFCGGLALAWLISRSF